MTNVVWFDDFFLNSGNGNFLLYFVFPLDDPAGQVPENPRKEVIGQLAFQKI